MFDEFFFWIDYEIGFFFVCVGFEGYFLDFWIVDVENSCICIGNVFYGVVCDVVNGFVFEVYIDF